MASLQRQLNIEMLGQTFTLETQGDLKRARDAANMLTEKANLAAGRLGGAVTSAAKMGVLVLAALDIAHSYLELKECHEGFVKEVESRSERLMQRMEAEQSSAKP